MSIDQKISQAKAKLLVNYPLFGALASKLELSVNDDIESFKSNGIKLEYNSDFLAELSDGEMEFVFANGAMHASLAHESRRNGRSGWLWQLATDYAINDMLVKNSLLRPLGAHYSKRFSGMYAEEIYAELKDDILRDELEYEADDIEDTKSDSDNQNSSKNPEFIQEEQLFEEFAKAKFDESQKNNEIPASMERFFTLTCNSKIDWRDELRVALDKFYRDDYTLLPPSKKLLYSGIYLPSSKSQTFRFVVAIDSSGSVDEILLGTFLSELNFIMNTFSNFHLDLLVCDDKIQTHKTFYSGDILEVELNGGGATDFRAVFEFIEKGQEDVKLLLYFSDLDGIFPKNSPMYEVKWIAPKESQVPFGEVIVMEP
ncbi:MAG: VWA-like domain-containing protein [Sulfurimonas denitrificans]|nr:VWA-like domain-containing protein [Sulfurimonas denitrificans]